MSLKCPKCNSELKYCEVEGTASCTSSNCDSNKNTWQSADYYLELWQERCEKAEALLADRDKELAVMSDECAGYFKAYNELKARVEAVSEVIKNRCEHCGVYKSDKCTGELCTFFDILNLLKEPKEAE